MVRVFVVLLSLLFITSSSVVFAKNHHNNGRYNEEYYCGFITSRLNPCCNGYGDSEKCKQKQYKKWNKKCRKHHGNNCSYNFWYGNRSWDDDEWFDYWNSDTYRNVQKVNHKVNVFKSVVNSTKELFTW